ncbi:YscO family type III secretion system apparatus protein [Pseudomonas aeruginosa]|nr:YscO family type III secretion system apparatus protein [Pseudomonas aeruginosa]
MSLALLLRVRRLRLDRAERAQGRQLLRVRAAAQEHTERQAAQRDYRDWRLAEEQRLFLACQAAMLDRRRLEAWQQQVGLLRERKPAWNRTAPRPRSASKGSASACGRCRRELLERQRQLEKFAELERHVDAERQGLRERSEEGDLEEFTRHETWPCSS